MGDKVRAHVFLAGRVQGVAYRFFAEKYANLLNVKGWVRNLYDGRVEVLAEGDRENVDQFLERLKQGPRMALVENVDLTWENYSGEFPGFEISGMW